jgi:peptidoglycan hydrolase-like protein with peptidoglycan-binding domain
MTKRIWLAILGAVLIVSAAPVVSAARSTAAAQSSAKKKKSTSSKNKSKKKSKPTAHGQKAPTSDRIREIQTALNREGVLSGEPTGKWDDTTIGAMKKYQENHGLNPTGKIDAGTLNKMGLGSDTAGRGAPTPSASSATSPAASAH